MAGPLKNKIITALKRLESIETAFDVQLDPDSSATFNALRMETTQLSIKNELRLLQYLLDEISTAQTLWADLLRKMPADERDLADKESDKFHKDKDVIKKMDQVNITFKSLRGTERTAALNYRIAKIAWDAEARETQHKAALQLAQLGAATGSSSTTPQPVSYNLPTLQLHHFSGDREKWVEFWEGFKSAVDSRPIENSEKLNYLRNFLDGQASKIIEGLPLKGENYSVAVKLLKQYYGNEEEYIRVLYGKLHELRPCRTFDEVKSMAIELERLCRQLEAVEENIEEPSVYLALEKKLTVKILREILEIKAADPNAWSTTKFRTALGKTIQKEETIQTVIREAHGDQSEHGNGRKRKISLDRESYHTIGAVDKVHLQQPEHKQSARKRPCIFCRKDHWDADCPFTLEQRKSIIRENQLCFKCLGKSHFANQCTRASKCRICKELHPTPLCVKETYKSERKASAESDQIRAVGIARHAKHSKSKGLRKALLMTTRVTVFNPAIPNKGISSSVFIDCGSQKSFITNSLARKLSLPIIRKEDCYLAGFGDQQAKIYPSSVVQLGMLTQSGEKLILSLNSMKFLVTKMTIVDLTEVEEDALQSERLDINLQSEPPQLIIGIDIFNELKFSSPEKLPSGFTLTNSIIGKILSGEGVISKHNSTRSHAIESERLTGVAICTSGKDQNFRPSSHVRKHRCHTLKINEWAKHPTCHNKEGNKRKGNGHSKKGNQRPQIGNKSTKKATKVREKYPESFQENPAVKRLRNTSQMQNYRMRPSVRKQTSPAKTIPKAQQLLTTSNGRNRSHVWTHLTSIICKLLQQRPTGKQQTKQHHVDQLYEVPARIERKSVSSYSNIVSPLINSIVNLQQSVSIEASDQTRMRTKSNRDTQMNQHRSITGLTPADVRTQR